MLLVLVVLVALVDCVVVWLCVLIISRVRLLLLGYWVVGLLVVSYRF